jgi:hypothetical protein
VRNGVENALRCAPGGVRQPGLLLIGHRRSRVRELPSGLEALDGPLLIRGHHEKPILPETLHAHLADAQKWGDGVRLPRLGLTVYRHGPARYPLSRTQTIEDTCTKS